MIDLDALNAASATEFAAALEGVFEHTPWIAARTAEKRPLASIADLHAALMQTVAACSTAERDALLAAHPDLAADRLPNGLTAASATEQSGLGMAHAPGAADLPAMNRAYRERFGFPFIVCVARHTAENVLRLMAARLEREPDEERDAALEEIGRISLLRLLARVTGPGLPPIAGRLSTHVLDVAAGRPAAALLVSLCQERRLVAEATTDPEGRVVSLLPAGPLRQGHYELHFAAAPYFAASGATSLYETIPIRFRIDDSEAHFHIPLLLAPNGYTTYRGS